MKYKSLLLVLLLNGCAWVHSKTYSDTGKLQTKVIAFTVCDSHNSLTKLRNSNATTTNGMYGAGTSLSGLDQSATTTNMNEIIGVVVQAAVKGAK
jgi:hypothetical protein